MMMVKKRKENKNNKMNAIIKKQQIKQMRENYREGRKEFDGDQIFMATLYIIDFLYI